MNTVKIIREIQPAEKHLYIKVNGDIDFYAKITDGRCRGERVVYLELHSGHTIVHTYEITDYEAQFNIDDLKSIERLLETFLDTHKEILDEKN